MTILTIMIIMALIATLAALAWGVGSMAHGGHYDDKHSEQLMFARASLQAVAFILVILGLVFSMP
jgi:hypothetical protein